MSQWVRLWDDMPTDPKWRVIARKSGRSISEVMAVFNFMMISAANATERGELSGWDDEDVGAALDLDGEHITAIRDAMQGKVLEGDRLKGWEKRQPLREDGAAERARAWREKQSEQKRLDALAEESERKRTQANARERPEEKREDTDKIDSSLCSESTPSPEKPSPACKPKFSKSSPIEILKTVLSEKTARDVIDHRKAKRAPLTPRAAELLVAAFRDHGDPERAAEAMIANGWQGFKPEWMANQSRAGPPPPAQRSNGTRGFVGLVLADIAAEEGYGGGDRDSGVSGGREKAIDVDVQGLPAIRR